MKRIKGELYLAVEGAETDDDHRALGLAEGRRNLVPATKQTSSRGA